jgi:hypothetical protein
VIYHQATITEEGDVEWVVVDTEDEEDGDGDG